MMKVNPVKATDLWTLYDTMTAKILEAFATYQQNGSGWMLKGVLRMNITLSGLRPLRGSSHMVLPEALAKRKALINMANDDEECFKWAFTRALNPVDKNPQRVTKLLREQTKELCWDGVKFPTPCSERVFRKFEKNNDISLRVFGHQLNNNGGVAIIPLYAPKERRERVVRLFFLKSKDVIASHYCVVKNMSALVRSQVSKKKAKKYVCDFCLCPFGRQDLLDAHTEYCSKHGAVKTVMPIRGRNTLKFKNIQNTVECPIKIYADFETHRRGSWGDETIPAARSISLLPLRGFSRRGLFHGPDHACLPRRGRQSVRPEAQKGHEEDLRNL